MNTTPKLNPDLFRGEAPSDVYTDCHCNQCGWADSFRADAIRDGKVEGFCDKCEAYRLFEIERPLPPYLLAFARKMHERIEANMGNGAREEWRKRNVGITLEALCDKAFDLYQCRAGLGDRDNMQRIFGIAVYALFCTDACGEVGG